jgi:outer membrane cobalamin receptor
MLHDRTFAELEIRLAPTVVLLAPLEIVALSPPRTSPVLENVEHRRTRGFGVQISRQEIEERRPLQISDVLMELPGVYAERRRGAAGGRTIHMGRALVGVGGGECPVQVFLDGMLATRDRPGGDVLVDDLASPLDVEVIEVFRGLASVPPEFFTPDARCGVIAIWTKRSLGQQP